MIKRKIAKLERLAKLVIPVKYHPLFTPFKHTVDSFTRKRRLSCIWFITWSCNYRCPYCWQLENPGEFRKKYDITYRDWLAGFHRQAKDFDEIVCGISGGEPFVFENFIQLLEELPENMFYDITSNLSFDINRFIKVATNCVGVVCSFHPSNPLNRDIYVQEFMQKAKALTIFPNTRVNFVAAPPNLRYYETIRAFCENNKLPLHVDAYVPLKEENRLPFENDEQRKLVEDILSKDRATNRRGTDKEGEVECSAGSEYLVLLPDGSAYPCLSMAQRQKNKVGDFTDSSFALNRNYMKCSLYPKCAGCDFDNIKVR